MKQLNDRVCSENKFQYSVTDGMASKAIKYYRSMACWGWYDTLVMGNFVQWKYNYLYEFWIYSSAASVR